MTARLSPTARKVLDKFIWVLSTGRNAVVVIACLFLAMAFDPVLPDEATRNTTFILTGNIEAGLPPFQLPAFSVEYEGKELDLLGMISELGSALVIIPLIAILENVAIAKAFCEFRGQPCLASRAL